MSKKFILVLVLGVVVVVGYLIFNLSDRKAAPEAEPSPSSPELIEQTKKVKRIDFSSLNKMFRFSAEIPAEWEVEYIPELTAVNVYDPAAPALSIRDKSQIYITRFEANRFLTISTVTITRQDKTAVAGHDAVLYEIEKKPGVPNFRNQPAWRNKKHRATDIRFSRNNPSLFYPFAYNPELSEDIFQKLIDSLAFHNDEKSLIAPLSRMKERIVKKPFGIYVTPQTSPIQPDRVTGYHTAPDYEIFPDEKTIEVPVRALCGGPLKLKREAKGYGGVAVQECLLEDNLVTVIYGHVALSSIKGGIGDYFAPGDKIGRLGDQGTETDGERKHLHFGVHKGNELDIRGYVGSESGLSEWLDPQPFLVRAAD